MTTMAAWEAEERSAAADVRRSRKKPKTKNVWALFTRLMNTQKKKPLTIWYLLTAAKTKKEIQHYIAGESLRDDGAFRQLRIVKTTVRVPED